jgi:hypothetical protein
MTEHIFKQSDFQGKTRWVEPKQSEREIWDKAVAEGKKGSRFDLKPDRAAIRRVLRESREHRGVRVRYVLP